jgi:two-component system, LuxR family, response regulator FixJ
VSIYPCVYIVDDDVQLGNAISWLLRTEGINSRIFQSAESFLTACRADMQGCVLMDLQMTGMSGLEAQLRLRELGSHIPILFLSGQGHVPEVRQAFLNGAIDFIEKPYNPDELLRKVWTALEQSKHEQEKRKSQIPLQKVFDQLTPRQKETLKRVMDGESSKQIGKALGISPRTVEVHRALIMQKFEVDSVAKLISMIHELDAFHDPDNPAGAQPES